MFGRDSTDRKEHLKDPYPGLFQNPPLLYTAARTTAATFSSSRQVTAPAPGTPPAAPPSTGSPLGSARK